MLFQGIRLQFINASLMLLKYVMLIGIGYILGLIIAFVPGVVEYLATFNLNTVSFMVLLVIISSSFSNIFGKGQ